MTTDEVFAVKIVFNDATNSISLRMLGSITLEFGVDNIPDAVTEVCTGQ
jgi:hypothetical protein